MHNHTHTTDQTNASPAFWSSRSGIALLVMGAVAGFLLLQEHWVHAKGYLPYLLILACPLMHLFMHGGHGGPGHQGHDGHTRSAGPDPQKPEKPNA